MANTVRSAQRKVIYSTLINQSHLRLDTNCPRELDVSHNEVCAMNVSFFRSTKPEHIFTFGKPDKKSVDKSVASSRGRWIRASRSIHWHYGDPTLGWFKVFRTHLWIGTTPTPAQLIIIRFSLLTSTNTICFMFQYVERRWSGRNDNNMFVHE